MSGKPRSNAIPWTAFLLGAGASIAANVAHAAERNNSGTDIGAMLFAAWAPVALLLVAEMMVRGQRPRGMLSVVEWVGAFLVALAAAVVSYGHMRGLLLQYGESELVAVLLPLSVDGLVVVASVALAAGRRNRAEQQRNEARTEERKADEERNTEQPDEERKAEQSPEQSPEQIPERKEERKAEQSPERKEEQQRNPERDEERKTERDEEQSPERKEERDEEQQRNEERKTEQERKDEERKAEQQRNMPEQQGDEERNVRVPVVEVGSPTTVPVTVTPPHSAERRSAVEWVAEQLRNGATLTGAEIGARYGRTDRWGRNVLRDARQQLAAAVPA